MLVKSDRKYPGIYHRIDKQGKKTFYTYYRVHGKQRWTRIGSETEGETVAKAFRHRAAKLAEAATSRAASGYTLDDAFKLYYQEISPNNRTSDRELDWYNRLIRPDLGKRQLENVSAKDVRDLRTRLLEEGFKLNSLKTILGMIKRIYRFAIREGIYQGFNPGDVLTWRKSGTKRNRALTLDEIASLLIEAKKVNLDLYRQVFIALNTGLRKSEIFNLTPGDIDLENHVLRLRSVKSKMDNKERIVLVPQSVVQIFKEIIQEKSLRSNQKLFDGNNINWRYWAAAVNAVGINDDKTGPDVLTFHGLRHTYASLIADSSSDPFVIKSQLGHSKIETSMIYTHTKMDLQKARPHVDLLGDMITKAEAEKNRPKLQVVHGGKV